MQEAPQLGIPYAPVAVEHGFYVVTCPLCPPDESGERTEFARHMGSTAATQAAAVKSADDGYARHYEEEHGTRRDDVTGTVHHTETAHSGTEPVPAEEIRAAIRTHVGDAEAVISLWYEGMNGPQFTAHKSNGTEITDGYWCIDGPNISVISE